MAPPGAAPARLLRHSGYPGDLPARRGRLVVCVALRVWLPRAVVAAGRRDRAPARTPALPGSTGNGVGARRPEGAALNKYGNSNHERGAMHVPAVVSDLEQVWKL